MRQTIIKIIVLLGVWVCGALPALCDNAVQMVTYFPVPYAKYNNLHISDKFYVGTNGDSFTLELGNPDSENSSLQIATSNNYALLKHVNNNALALDMDVWTTIAVFGNYGVADEDEAQKAKLTFEKNLRVQDFNASGNEYVKSVTADDMQIDGHMYWFQGDSSKSKLPGCAYTVHWKKISLNKNPARDAWFLVCEPSEPGGGSGSCSEGYEKVGNKCCQSNNPASTYQYYWLDTTNQLQVSSASRIGDMITLSNAPSDAYCGETIQWQGAYWWPARPQNDGAAWPCQTLPDDLGSDGDRRNVALDCKDEFPEARIGEIRQCYKCIGIEDKDGRYLNYYFRAICSFEKDERSCVDPS